MNEFTAMSYLPASLELREEQRMDSHLMMRQTYIGTEDRYRISALSGRCFQVRRL